MPKLSCPGCRSKRLVKDGKVFSGRKKKQRFLCCICGLRTVYPNRSE